MPSNDPENSFLSARPLVLVVSPGDETYRGYCLEQVAAAYDVVLLTGTEPSWEKPYIVDHAVVDLHDDTALLAAGRALAARHQLAGVVTWQEWHLVSTARLARALGLHADSVEVMRACRNKATARTLFARHGVPSAASLKARTLLEAAQAMATISFPAVIKPAALAGSIGVGSVASADIGIPPCVDASASAPGGQRGHQIVGGDNSVGRRCLLE